MLLRKPQIIHVLTDFLRKDIRNPHSIFLFNQWFFTLLLDIVKNEYNEKELLTTVQILTFYQSKILIVPSWSTA